jgi:hypothetical protein
MSKQAEQYVIKRVVRQLENWQLQDIILRTDQEPSIKAIALKVREQRAEYAKTVLQESLRRSHQSLGAAERWHRTLQEEMRVIRLQLDQQMAGELQSSDMAAVWLVRHAAWLLFRFHRSRELGSTAYFRLHGVECSEPLVLFRERGNGLKDGQKDSGLAGRNARMSTWHRSASWR